MVTAGPPNDPFAASSIALIWAIMPKMGHFGLQALFARRKQMAKVCGQNVDTGISSEQRAPQSGCHV